jgi:hypothetical protein
MGFDKHQPSPESSPNRPSTTIVYKMVELHLHSPICLQALYNKALIGSISPFLQATKAFGNIRGIALSCFLDLGTKRG